MNSLQSFNNTELGNIRATEIDGEAYFVGKDVADVLGYNNPQKALRDHVDEEDRTLNESFTVNGTMVILINESGLYSLVLRSQLPTAKKFKRWVTSEVLPSIRKHGAYATPATIESIIANPDNGIRLLQALKEEQNKRKELEAKTAEMAPKALFADAVSASETSILVGQLAKIIKQNGYDIGQNRLFHWLRINGYLGKSGNNRNLPTQRSMGLGLFEIKESVFQNPDGSVRITKTPKITGKGQIYFINKLIRKETRDGAYV